MTVVALIQAVFGLFNGATWYDNDKKYQRRAFKEYLEDGTLNQNITGGWLVTNIWHTAQYLMLVWVFNENQNGKPANPGDWFRRFTDGNRAWAYMAVCIILAWPVYALINASLSWGATGLMVALIASQTLNFHHFIVDSVIWRARRKPAAT